jgi:hypothetical protein
MAVSASNPLGIAWSAGMGAGAHFAQVTNTTTLAVDPVVSLTGSVGVTAFIYPATWLRIVPAAGASTVPQWHVAAMDASASGATTHQLRVWEVLAGMTCRHLDRGSRLLDSDRRDQQHR